MVLDVGRIKHRGDLMHKSIGSNGAAIPSNWRLSADGLTNVVWTPETPPGTPSLSYGSNANDVSSVSAAGASSLVTRADHVHRGVRTITSNGSNGLFGDVNLQAGTGIALGVTGQTVTVTNIAGASGGGGGTNLTIEEVDGSPTVAATKLVLPNGTLGVVGTVATYTPAAGGGVQLSGLDRAPASPHAKDDEFEGASLDAKWTIPASSGAGQEVTATLENGVVAITPTTAGSSSTGKRFFGISQAAPSGSFSVMAKLGEAGLGTDRRFGMYCAVAGSTGHIIGPFKQDNTIAARGVTTTSTTGDWSAVDAFAITTASAGAPSWALPAWVKIVWDSSASTLTFYWSSHGLVWILLGSRSAMSQPNTIGICLYSNGATVRADDVLSADWFRVTEP